MNVYFDKNISFIAKKIFADNNFIEVCNIKEADIICIKSKMIISTELIKSIKNLKCIATYSVGVDHICKTDKQIISARVGSIDSVVELVLFFMLDISRRFSIKSRDLTDGKWNRGIDGCNSLRGKTLGIVGYGNIGKKVECLGKFLGMNILINNLDRYTPLSEILSNSDIVTLHIDGRVSNVGFFNEDKLLKMKQNSILINTSRGKVIDESALFKNLDRFKGVGLDVFNNEPEDRVALLKLSNVMSAKNVVITPHIAGLSIEAQENIAIEVSQKAIEYMRSFIK